MGAVRDRVVALHRDGMKDREIAEALGMRLANVQVHLSVARKVGELDRPTRTRQPVRRQRVVALYQQGMGYREIAASLAMPPQSVANYLSEAGRLGELARLSRVSLPKAVTAETATVPAPAAVVSKPAVIAPPVTMSQIAQKIGTHEPAQIPAESAADPALVLRLDPVTMAALRCMAADRAMSVQAMGRAVIRDAVAGIIERIRPQARRAVVPVIPHDITGALMGDPQPGRVAP